MGFGTASSQGDEPGFQLAPMIDVVFQLLIFFLLATSFQKFEAKIDSDLPQQQQEEPDKKPKQIIVKVTAGGLIVNNLPMKKREFALRMATLKEHDPNQFVFIDGSDDALHRDVIEIFDTLNQMDISVTVIPPYEKKP